MITPILKDPKSHGGTLYTFPSASRDLTRAFSNSEYEFAFSHFACLNIPDFRYGKFKDAYKDESGNEIKCYKGVYLENIHPDCINLVNGNLNKALKWHLQSYVMNYEISLLNGFSLDTAKYDSDILRTPSERIFFDWLQKVGAIKFSSNVKNATTTESLNDYGYNVDVDDISIDYLSDESYLPISNDGKNYIIGNKLYTWKGGEWKSRILVSKTVQYIGTIDMVNNVSVDYDSFNEIYLNIPASVGGSVDIYFNNISDDNYTIGDKIDVKKDIYCNIEDENRDYIIGRYYDDFNMSDVDMNTLKAIYDSEYNKDSGYKSPIYNINSGYCINFNDSNYVGGSIEEMNLNSNEDFEFNCVLIYYKIKKAGGGWVTNLYGVLFLEEATTSDINTNINDYDKNELCGYIQRYPKFKNGNSWGLKLDLKIDAQPDSQMELREYLYDDPNGGGVGMQMFTEALVQLNDCVKIFYDVKKENTDIEERLYTLENMVSGIDTVYELRDDVSVLRTRVEMFQPALDSLTGRMDDVESKLTKLENNLGYLIRDIKQTNSSFETRLLDIDNSIKSINKTNSLFETRIFEIDGSIKSIKERIGSIESSFKEGIGSIESKLTEKISNIDSSIESIKERIESLKTDVNVGEDHNLLISLDKNNK